MSQKSRLVKGGFKVYIPNGSGSFAHSKTGGARGSPFRRRDVDRSCFSACRYGCGHLRVGFHAELGRRHTTKGDRGSLAEANPGDGYAGSHRPTRRREARDLQRHPERYVACQRACRCNDGQIAGARTCWYDGRDFGAGDNSERCR
jgi:hypothetical protein